MKTKQLYQYFKRRLTMFNFKNKEKGEVLLVKLNHILLKEGDNELDLTPRRMNIAKEEIEKRKLDIEIIELGDKNAVQTENKGKTKKQEPEQVAGNEQAKN